MNGLILLLGESFRSINKGQRVRGLPESYDEQIKACKSHIAFIENIKNISVFISSYTTQYDDELLSIYQKYLVGHKFYDNVIGLNSLFHESIKSVNNIQQYDFVLFIRIDLFLKDKFTEVFDPNIIRILFPTICWKQGSVVRGKPRVNDMMLFIPKKYYSYIKDIEVYHNAWAILVEKTDLKKEDLDAMIDTFHDSDSAKDFNPLYYIVNRKECQVWHSKNDIFNKYDFR